jgi:hypothetical protein
MLKLHRWTMTAKCEMTVLWNAVFPGVLLAWFGYRIATEPTIEFTMIAGVLVCVAWLTYSIKNLRSKQQAVEGFRTRSKPTAFAALMAKHDRMPKPAPFDGLEILVRPVGRGSLEYSFTFSNTGEQKLFDLRIESYDAYQILGPEDFGLDDTHMASSLTREPLIEIGELLPGEAVSLRRKRWGNLARYNGPASMQVRARLRVENEARSEVGYLIKLRVIA